MRNSNFKRNTVFEHPKMWFTTAFVASVLGATAPAIAADREFLPIPAADGGTGVSFSIGFTAGVHKGRVSKVDGSLKVDDQDRLMSAHFSVPITAMSTGDATRDCHMREALGIDYSKSKFPADHACNSQNQLPDTGGDSVVFPFIEFDFQNFKLANGEVLPTQLEVGKTYELAVQGSWLVHGQSHNFGPGATPDSILVHVQKTDATSNVLRLTSKLEIILKDHGIVVKPFKLFGPFAITVSDRVKVNLDLLVAPKPDAPAPTPAPAGT